MAAVVFVHGIAQEQSAEDLQIGTWLPALAGGVRNAGNNELANRIYDNGKPGDLDVRMAFYGNLFSTDTPLPEPITREQLETTPLPEGTDEVLLQEFGQYLLESAATSAKSKADRHIAAGQLDIVSGKAGEAMGPRALLRPVMNGLSQLRWFTDPVMKVAAPTVWHALTQVTRYLSDDSIRSKAQQRVLDLIDDDTRLVIGHSLGSVVAYESMHNTDHPAALITLGSPLGLKNVVYREGRLQRWPAHVPEAATSWYNFAAEDDLVAARLDIAPYFPPAPGKDVTPVSHIVDTGSKPHDITHYLTKPSCGQAVTYALA
jgi:hypothetical protein